MTKRALFAGWLILFACIAGASPGDHQQRLPLFFEEHSDGFVARGHGFSIHLQGGHGTLTFAGGAGLEARLENASENIAGVGLDRQPGRANYLLGGESPRSLATFSRVRFREVYPGIDLEYYGKNGQLEFDFIVAPGVDPDSIAMRFPGAADARLTAEGDLELATEAGPLRLRRPFIYQRLGDERQVVSGRYDLAQDGRVAFELGAYDETRPLVIDPVILYSTYFGGRGDEAASSIAVDAEGNIFLAGLTAGGGFRTAGGPLQPGYAGHGQFFIVAGDAFVAKFSPEGRLLYSTYFGGRSDDAVVDMKVDQAGDVYIAGLTYSTNFRTTPEAAQTAFGGAGNAIHTSGDAFVAKLSGDGQTLIYSTYLGGSDGDAANALEIDADGAAYVTGQTLSDDFPITDGVLQTTNRGDGRAEALKAGDVFVTKVAPDGSAFEYSTFLGGSDDESAFGIALGADMSVFVAGFTRSRDFPVTANAIQDTYGGSGGSRNVTLGDAFVAKLNPDVSALTYATYLGGNRDDTASGIALDAIGCAYITGNTLSTGFPVTDGAFQTEYSGAGGEAFWSAGDGFVAKINEDGDTLLYSTFVGGSQDDRPFAITVDGDTRAYITGHTLSDDYPLTDDATQTENAGAGGQGLSMLGDAFVTVLDQQGAALEYSSYIGGAMDDLGFDIVLDADNTIYISGNTMSEDFPTTQGAVSRRFMGRFFGVVTFGTGDAVWLRLEGLPAAPPTVTTISSASFAVGEPVAPASLATGFAPGIAEALAVAQSTDLPTVIDGVTVDVTDSEGVERPARLHSVAPGQVSYEIPADAAVGTAQVQVTTSAGAEIMGTIEIAPVAPGIYTANSQGFGAPAAFFLFVPADGSPPVQNFVFDSALAPVALSLGEEGDQLFIILFGTGMRAGATATATINGVEVAVAGPVAHSVFPGLDQANLGPIPRSLIGQGVVEIVLLVDGIPANTVTVNFE